MNIRTMTTAATWLAAAALAFAGCAAEETSDTPTGNAANNNNNNNGTVTNNTAAATGPSNTTTINTVAAVTTTTTTSTTGAAVTGTTSAGPTTTTATVTGSTTAAVTITNTATVNNTTGAGTTGGGATCDAPPAAGTAPIIDDFEDNDHTISPNEGRLGYWYEYGDPAGSQMTAPLDGVEGSGGVLTATGSGFEEYVGFGVDLNNDNANSDSCPYDASAHAGVQFDITNDVSVTFQVALPGTTADSNHYSITVPAATNGTFKAAFTMLAQEWGDPVDWDPSQITKLQWQITDPTEAFNITLDNVSFY